MAAAIHQDVSLSADPARVYRALTDPEQFGELTGAPVATLSAEEGAPFSLFGGTITGRNVELAPNRRIVQAWRPGNWPEGVYSIVKFELEGDGGSRTKVALDHTGFPEEAHDHLVAGWHENYWKPLERYLG